jgi:hypothetical protein
MENFRQPVTMKINLPSTTLQIPVAKALQQVRNLHLRKALTLTVKKVELATINRELDENAPANDLNELADFDNTRPAVAR